MHPSHSRQILALQKELSSSQSEASSRADEIEIMNRAQKVLKDKEVEMGLQNDALKAQIELMRKATGESRQEIDRHELELEHAVRNMEEARR